MYLISLAEANIYRMWCEGDCGKSMEVGCKHNELGLLGQEVALESGLVCGKFGGFFWDSFLIFG